MPSVPEMKQIAVIIINNRQVIGNIITGYGRMFVPIVYCKSIYIVVQETKWGPGKVWEYKVL